MDVPADFSKKFQDHWGETLEPLAVSPTGFFNPSFSAAVTLPSNDFTIDEGQPYMAWFPEDRLPSYRAALIVRENICPAKSAANAAESQSVYSFYLRLERAAAPATVAQAVYYFRIKPSRDATAPRRFIEQWNTNDKNAAIDLLARFIEHMPVKSWRRAEGPPYRPVINPHLY